ncbi:MULTISPECIES: aldo/keto reductase [unclassified Chelatococcus]|uniref:aldo/keto reductase n=1 Tax=unclassified Chelatococcus TaxID=2638111 RepID=UPI001BCA723A|nr:MULTISPECIES: aldo/keto reductase [unclassified Chelatococcus]CAH1669429.1 Glyoxal reductase [Hyphomicrobiales bacterium]MBS7738205.1 aldo/keto reductase [Chelatococcus sp. HY11]MBX3545733.1 aldo/keto reductase [Chelatococcus sp.]MCO5077449.1 aldo/keto reductase [Chelatococcus sp.]CAH1678352.1 Glyoxal reductase [Hyphomicrobiales bacterium]
MATVAYPTVPANGANMPVLGLGTWQSRNDEAAAAVEAALQNGYRHLDTAIAYDNEEAVGEGLRSAGVPREGIFITSKVPPEQIGSGALERAAEASLKRLKLDYLDLILIHWPNPSIPLKESMRALNAAKREGLVRHIGVSNFPVALIEEAVHHSAEPLATNQCEYHPRLDQSAVLAACRRHGIAFTSYAPLGRTKILSDPVIAAIAERTERTPAQVVLRWHIQQPDVVAIPKSQSPDRIVENSRIFDFALDDDDMAAISALARPDGRQINPSWGPQWDGPK